MLAAVACVVLMGQGAAPPSNSVVRSLTVVDGQGNPRIYLGVDAAGWAKLEIKDERKATRAELMVFRDDAAHLGFRDKQNRRRLRLGMGVHSPTFVIRDHKRPRIAFGVVADNTATAWVADENGKKIWQAPPK